MKPSSLQREKPETRVYLRLLICRPSHETTLWSWVLSSWSVLYLVQRPYISKFSGTTLPSHILYIRSMVCMNHGGVKALRCAVSPGSSYSTPQTWRSLGSKIQCGISSGAIWSGTVQGVQNDYYTRATSSRRIFCVRACEAHGNSRVYHKAKAIKSALLIQDKGEHTGVRFALIPGAPGLVATKL